jgi:hypothetical protein
MASIRSGPVLCDFVDVESWRDFRCSGSINLRICPYNRLKSAHHVGEAGEGRYWKTRLTFPIIGRTRHPVVAPKIKKRVLRKVGLPFYYDCIDNVDGERFSRARVLE